MIIRFWRVHGEKYGAFSNFSPHAFFLDSQYWRTVEHYFQSMKFAGTPYADTIRCALTPKEAARLGRARAYPLRTDWEMIKESVMRSALLAKFDTHVDIRNLLISTGEQVIIEASPYDEYWGSGRSGHGKNRLGYLLMELREYYRNGLIRR